METFFAQLFLSVYNGVHCTAAVQPVARLLNFVFAYFLRLVDKTITFLLGIHPEHHWGGDHNAPPDNQVTWGAS